MWQPAYDQIVLQVFLWVFVVWPFGGLLVVLWWQVIREWRSRRETRRRS